MANYTPRGRIRGVRGQANLVESDAECDAVLADMVACGANVIYLPAWYNNEALYASNYITPRAYDAFAYFVPEAHKRNIKVFALCVCAYIGWPDNSAWNAALNYSCVSTSWLDFAIAAARAFLCDVVDELVSDHSVDGILLDYCRWNNDYYDAGCGEVQIFASDISQTVQDIYAEVAGRVPLAASVYRHVNAGHWIGQYWDDWLDGGYIDYVTPMAYVTDTELEDTCIPSWQGTGHFPDRIIPRLSTVDFGPDPDEDLPVEDVLRQVLICRRHDSAGMAFYDIGHIGSNAELTAALGVGGWQGTQFDQVNDYFVVADDPGLTLQDGSWVVGFWTVVMVWNGSYYQYALSNGAWGGNGTLNVFLGEESCGAQAGKWVLQVVDDGGNGPGELVSSTTPAADSVWRLVICQRDAVAGEIQLWLCDAGGSALKAASGADTNFGAVNGGDWHIGRRQDGNSDRYFGNWLMQIFKGDFALTQAQIEGLASGIPIRTLAGRLGYSLDLLLPMRETEATVYDESGNGNNATRQSSPTTVAQTPPGVPPFCTAVKRLRR